TICGASRPPGPGRGTRCPSSPGATSGCSCATSGPTSRRAVRTPTPPAAAAAPTRAARACVARLDSMGADPQYRVAMGMQAGDMQFINNYHVLHGRDGYTDDREAGKIRHLKRLW